MKTLVILSDTHGNFDAINKLLGIINESDYLVHLGDRKSDITVFSKEIRARCVSVMGNCDGGGGEEIFEVENLKILACHGHEYGVKYSLTKLYYRAKEVGANVVLYGHTHINKIENYNGIVFINPGCTAKYSQNTYCYAVVNGDKITSKIVNIY